MVGAIPVIREHIVATPGTCGGKPRIAGTRIRVKEVAICYAYEGMSPEAMTSQWPHVDVASIFAALAYYHDHRDEIDAEIAADDEWYREQKAKGPSPIELKLMQSRGDDAANDPLPS